MSVQYSNVQDLEGSITKNKSNQTINKCLCRMKTYLLLTILRRGIEVQLEQSLQGTKLQGTQKIKI